MPAQTLYREHRAAAGRPSVLAATSEPPSPHGNNQPHRLSKQVSSYYDDCSRLLTSAPLTSHFDKSWVAHAGVKSMLYDVEAIVQSSAALAAADPLAGVAQEIARLKVIGAGGRGTK